MINKIQAHNNKPHFGMYIEPKAEHGKLLKKTVRKFGKASRDEFKALIQKTKAEFKNSDIDLQFFSEKGSLGLDFFKKGDEARLEKFNNLSNATSGEKFIAKLKTIINAAKEYETSLKESRLIEPMRIEASVA